MSIGQVAHHKSVAKKSQTMEEERFVRETCDKTKKFFESYRSTFDKSVLCLGLITTIGYWTKRLDGQTCRLIVLSELLGSIAFDSIDAIASSLNIDLLDEKNAHRRMEDMNIAIKAYEKQESEFEKWKTDKKTLKLKVYSYVAPYIALGTFLGAVKLAVVATETILCPQLLLPRAALFFTKCRIQQLINEIRYTHDDVVLNDLIHKRWGGYSSLEEFDKAARSAIGRLLFRDHHKFQEMLEMYQTFDKKVLHNKK